MNNTANSRIRRILEELYDIPFEVDGGKNYNDSWFRIKPQNAEECLFDIEIRFKNQLRIIVEVRPERYAAFSIKDMASATAFQKNRFAEYARQLDALNAKIEFSINDSIYNPENPALWPEEWNNYRMRVSKSPIFREDEDIDETEVAGEWAAIITGMFLSLLNVTIDEKEHLEGGVTRVETNKYERNPINRELCLLANGYCCRVCGFDFEKVYGEIGHHFIHVHHLVPISQTDSAYVINPVRDLIPVCPNCHAMLHKSDPPYTPAELAEIIKQNRSHIDYSVIGGIKDENC